MIFSEQDQAIIDEIMKSEKLPNTYVPTDFKSKFVNLSQIQRFNYPFNYEIDKNRKNVQKEFENDIIVERIFPDEEFKIISDYAVCGISPNTYFISTYGRVFSMFYQRFVKAYDREGQFRVALSVYDFKNKCYKTKHFPIHRLVMLTFQWIYNANQYLVNHLDGNPHNNYIMNLEWCTYVWNCWHRDHILCTNSFQSNFKNLPASIVVSICEDLMKNVSTSDIMKKYGITNYMVEDIKQKHSYRYITSKYDFPEQMHILTDEEVENACKLLVKGHSAMEISRMLNTNSKPIYDIKNKKYHKNISSKYF